MYLLCSDWSIRSLEKKEEEKEEENCYLLITARCTNEGRDKKIVDPPYPPQYDTFGRTRGVISKVVLGFRNFRYDF